MIICLNHGFNWLHGWHGFLNYYNHGLYWWHLKSTTVQKCKINIQWNHLIRLICDSEYSLCLNHGLKWLRRLHGFFYLLKSWLFLWQTRSITRRKSTINIQWNPLIQIIRDSEIILFVWITDLNDYADCTDF